MGDYKNGNVIPAREQVYPAPNQGGVSLNRSLVFLVSMIIISSLLSLCISMTAIWKQMDDVRKVCNVAVVSAQKNGGFDEETVNLFYEMISRDNLEIEDVQYIPDKGVQVQKRDELQIRVKPKVVVNIPFAGVKIIDVGYIEVSGNSHKYWK